MANESLNVWIIDDDASLGENLAFLLRHAAEMECPYRFESVSSLTEFINQYEGRAKPWKVPDVLLLDVNFPETGEDGVDSLPLIKSCLPRTSIVMFTIRDDADKIFEAFRSGASGYLIKGATVEQITTAVREAAHGGVLMPAPVAKKVLGSFQVKHTQDYGLTAREKEVLQEMVNGYSHKEIATRLFITLHTVDSHLRKIYAKLHARSGIEAVAIALSEGLIDRNITS